MFGPIIPFKARRDSICQFPDAEGIIHLADGSRHHVDRLRIAFWNSLVPNPIVGYQLLMDHHAYPQNRQPPRYSRRGSRYVNEYLSGDCSSFGLSHYTRNEAETVAAINSDVRRIGVWRIHPRAPA